ncbi:MAG: LamG-like jellyroll fold domain-containing protein, partial [Limisphaerales bacterium]
GTVSYSGTQTGKVVVSASQRPQGNQALRLDGNGDSVATPLLDLSGSEITIQYWFRGSAPFSAVRQQSGGYLVAGWSGDLLHILSNDQGTAGISMGTNVVDGAWHHVVMTWKQDTAGGFASYLDGRLVAKRDSSNQPIPNHNAQVYLGSWNGTGEFTKGELDEIAIWRRALTASEIAAGWRSSPNGSEADLVAYWNFNDGTANDLSSAGHHGELLGDAAIVAADITNLGNAFEVETAGPGPYELRDVAPGSGYLVTAFLDVNGSGLADLGEPSGEFAGNPLTVTGSVGEVNISLSEPPRIVLPPIQVRTAPGGTAQFAVAAEGTAPLSYRWFKDGVALADGGRISGATGATLSVATTSTADEGEYMVEISNARGAVSSRPVSLLGVAGGRSVSGDLQFGGSGRVYVNAVRFPADDRALKLNGTGAYVVVPTLTDLSGAAGEELTIQYWFKGSSLQSAVRQQSGGFIVAGWGGLHILSHDGDVNGISAGAGVTDGQWHHVALTWKVGTTGGFASYLDGKPVEQRDSGFDPIPAHNAPVYFGAFNGTGEFASGLLDEISIWNRALSAEEIRAGWKQSLAGSEADLVGYWNFNSGTADDLSPNAHAGELNNGAEIVAAENAKRAGGDYVSAFTAPGPYALTDLPAGTNYRVTAFIDLNANGLWDGDEPTTAYVGNPFDLLADKTGVDLELGGGTEPPVLSISQAGGNVTIAWPAEVSGYVLQQTTSLMAPDWQPVTGVTGNTATLPTSGTSRFYRLVK